MKTLFLITVFLAAIVRTGLALDLEPIGVYETGVFDEGAAEIVAFHAPSTRLYIVNGNLPGIDVVDLSR